VLDHADVAGRQRRPAEIALRQSERLPRLFDPLPERRAGPSSGRPLRDSNLAAGDPLRTEQLTAAVPCEGWRRPDHKQHRHSDCQDLQHGRASFLPSRPIRFSARE